MARTLFENEPQPEPTPEAVLPKTEFQKMADAFYAPPQPYDFPPDNDSELFRYDRMLRSTFVGRESDALMKIGQTKEQYSTYAKDRVALGRKTGFPVETLAKVIDYEISDRIRAARGEPDVTVAQLHDMETRARQEVRAVYGDQTDRLLERATAYVRSNADLHKLMNTGGIGSRPDIVMAIVDHVHRNGIGKS
jgi:hypothetical protein